MAYEIDIEKWHGGVLLKYSDVVKAVKFFSAHDESGKKLKEPESVSKMEAIRRAVSFAVRDVKLTKAEESEVDAFVKGQYDRRMKKREQKMLGTVISKTTQRKA